jgi:cell division protein FtsL
LIRGRTWIALIAFALIGIVTLQLLVLRLNANIGRALVREAQLQRANAALSIESSELAAGERVESLTAKLGMELVPEGDLRFLSINPRADVVRAAATLSKPVQTTSSTSTEEATDASTSAANGEGGEAASTSTQASASSSTSAAGAATGQGGEASTAASETGAATTSESSATSSPRPTATPPASSAEASATGTAGATGAAEAAAGDGASGTPSGGAG